jgi:hypothetical protein
MNTRFWVTAGLAILASATLLCVKKAPEVQNTLSCIIGSDTLTQTGVSQLVPGALPPAGKMSRAALQCALSKQACRGTFTEKDREFFSDLSSQLGSGTGESWSPQAAASLYRAAKALQAKTRELPTALEVASYVDSLFASAVRRSDSGIVCQLLVNDSLLRSMGSIATREDLERILAEVFCIPLKSAGILTDFLISEEMEQKAVTEASSHVKGLVSRETTHVRKPPQVGAPSTLAKAQENLKLALMYRTQQSITDSIKRHLPNLEALYKRHLKIHQSLSGTVWVTFVINPDGRVASARIKSTDIPEKDFLNPFCTYVEKMHFLRIPDDLGPMTFEFPFEFSPEQ